MEPQTQPTKKTKSVLSTTVQPEVYAQVADLANEREWSVAQAGGYLIRLGLERIDEQKKSAPAEEAVAA